MKLGAVNVYKLLSAPVKEFRRANGLCLYCGESKHQVANCPNKSRQATGSLGTIVEEDLLNMRSTSGPDFNPVKRSTINAPVVTGTLYYPVNTIQEVTESRHKSQFILPVTIDYYGQDDEEELAAAEAMVDSGACFKQLYLSSIG
ncbi:hypothetical protein PS15p_201778 [Mucor circinelloides]